MIENKNSKEDLIMKECHWKLLLLQQNYFSIKLILLKHVLKTCFFVVVISRVLVMPPPYPLYLLDPSQLEGLLLKYCRCWWCVCCRYCLKLNCLVVCNGVDYFDINDISAGVETISFAEFLKVIDFPQPENDFIGKLKRDCKEIVSRYT